MRLRAILSAALLFFTSTSSADFSDQFIDPTDGMLDASAFITENAYGFLPIPVVVTEPAVGIGGGVVGLFFHESEDDRDARMETARSSDDASRYLMPPSVSVVAIAGTSNGSVFGGAGHMGFFKQDSIRYKGFIGSVSVNLDVYDVGPLPAEKEIELNTAGLAIGQSLLFRLPGSRVFIGMNQFYVETEIEPVNLSETLDDFPGSGPVIGEIKNWINNRFPYEAKNSSLGLVVAYDNRDSIFNPRKGYDYQFEYKVYSENLGGDFNYESAGFEGLNYWPLMHNLNIALRLDSEVIMKNDSFLPFYALPAITMRGIPMMRYQGEAVVLGEVQLTWDIDARWAINVFGGSGRAADSTSELSDASSRTTKGAGFRYQVAKRYGFYSGIDVAKGPEETAWYIKAGSTW